ncbi:MAG: polysaccharide biosynthesis/export family protein, partial [Pedobacter sp.]|nr:polysaccharide biosynthesis/export family protein [Chitinophagaceae bacterium]
MKNIYYCIVAFVLIVTVSCNSSRRVYKDYHYFQKGLDSIDKMVLKEPIIKPYDQLTIQVYSTTLNQEQVALFNIPNAGGYLVDEAGYIVIPIIGRLNVAELTTTQLRAIVLSKLATQVKNPEVIVRFLTYKINVLGEVGNKGIRNLPNQRVTLLDLLGNSGDLTENARRDNILVI